MAQPLYAVAFNKFTKHGWYPGKIIYVHANNANDAKITVIKAHRGKIDIIAAAPAIGYHIEDKQGKVLST